MAQSDVEIAGPVLPTTAASPDGHVLRLQEWLVVRGISVGENPGAAPGSAAAVGIDGDLVWPPKRMCDLRGHCWTGERNRRCGVLAGAHERHAVSL